MTTSAPSTSGALAGVFVLDFSTLLPGPLTTAMMAEAGAEVLKIERPGAGDGMRAFGPHIDGASVPFALLNHGKRTLTLDLKAPDAAAQLRPLIERADVIVEQFRPGVMARLGLGWSALRAINPRVVLCSITGYGQSGPKAQVAAHDLDYVAECGLLSLVRDACGAPPLPPALIADIAGGAQPAFSNILLALHERARTGHGRHLDIAMIDGVFAFLFQALAQGAATGTWPQGNDTPFTGATPRYAVYRTADDRHLAVAPLEQPFWDAFCEAIELPADLRDDRVDPTATRAAVAARLAQRTADAWMQHFAGRDVCCAKVATLDEAMADPHVTARGLFARRIRIGERSIPALPLPIDPQLRVAPRP